MRPQTPCGSDTMSAAGWRQGTRARLTAALDVLFGPATRHTATHQTLRSGVHRVRRSALATTPAYQNRANLRAFIEQLGTQLECRAAGPRAALRSWTELGAMCTALSQPLPRTKTPTKTRTMLSSSCTACVTATTQTRSKSMTGAAYWSSRQINDQRCLVDSPPPAPATHHRPSARSPTPPYCNT